MTKKEQLINQVKNFDDKYFNEGQKTIAIKLLEFSPEQEAQGIADFIFMKRRTGFGFDYSPEPAKGRLITLREDKNKRINVGDKVEDDENKLIIGDNYNALKALERTHKEKIDIVYIDPPYNTESAKNDGNQSSKEGKSSKFLYKDKFGRGGWLNMMKSRLTIAKELIADDGIILCSIDDTEYAYLKIIMDQIYGENNFITSFIWERTHHSNRNNSGKKVFRNCDYIVAYAKNLSKLKYFNEGKQTSFEAAPLYNRGNNIHNLKFPIGKVYLKKVDKWNDKELIIKFNSRWNQKKLDSEIKKGTTFIIKANKNKAIRAVYSNDKVEWKIPKQILNTSETFIEDYNYATTETGTMLLNTILEPGMFPYPKPIELIKYIINLKQNKNITILDFFAGSGTTGHATMELNKLDGGNRKFILCTNNENDIATKITYERLYRIISGKTTKGKNNFKWLDKNKPYKNTKLRVINIDDTVKISLDQKVSDKVINDCKNGLVLLNPYYDTKKELNLYYDLAALNPLKNNEDKF